MKTREAKLVVENLRKRLVACTAVESGTFSVMCIRMYSPSDHLRLFVAFVQLKTSPPQKVRGMTKQSRLPPKGIKHPIPTVLFKMFCPPPPKKSEKLFVSMETWDAWDAD